MILTKMIPLLPHNHYRYPHQSLPAGRLSALPRDHLRQPVSGLVFVSTRISVYGISVYRISLHKPVDHRNALIHFAAGASDFNVKPVYGTLVRKKSVYTKKWRSHNY